MGLVLSQPQTLLQLAVVAGEPLPDTLPLYADKCKSNEIVKALAVSCNKQWLTAQFGAAGVCYPTSVPS